MPEYLSSDNIYSGLDDSDPEEDELYNVAAGLGLGNSTYVPTEPTHYHHQQPDDDDETTTSTSFLSQRRQEDQVDPHTSSHAPVPTSSQVPRVPNVWVPDPSLEQGSSAKAREAQEEHDQYQNRRQSAAADQSDLYLGTSYHSSSPVATLSAAQPAPFSLLNPRPSAIASNSSVSSPAPSASTAAAYHHTPSHTASSSTAAGPRRSATVYSERSSLFGEAPPAYTPSPTSPHSNSGSTFNNYQTFFSPTSPRAVPSNTTTASSSSSSSTMGRLSESESHGLLAGQTFQPIPQSMGGDLEPNDDGHYEYPRPTSWKDRVRQFDWQKHWKLVLLGVVLTFVTVGFLVSSISGVKNEKTIKYPGNPGSSPVTSPGEKIPATDDDGTRLAYPPYDDETFADYNTRQCGDKLLQYNHVVLELDFSSSRNLTVFQDIKDENNHQDKDVRIQGDIVIRRSGEGTPQPSIILETASNHDAIQYNVEWNDEEQRLVMLTPRSIPWSETNTSPCLHIRATIWAPPNSELGSLNVESVHLGIVLLDNLSLKLSEFARLASTVGPVVSATDGEKDKTQLMRNPPPASFALDARYIEVKTMSAPISGAWPLLDYLGLETISGSITAGVTPKPALKGKPLPAVLYAHSTSGTIEVFEPIDAATTAWATQQAASEGLSTSSSAEAILPPRQYGVDLYSMSGSVKGRVAFGFSCKVHTTSGHVDLTLLPVMDRAQANRNGQQDREGTSSLETSTTSGTTVINVLEPLWGSDLQTGGAYVDLLATNGPPERPRDNDGQQIGARDPYEVIGGRDDTASLQPPAAAAKSAALRALNGRHTATSATLRVTYPGSWEGWIDEDSMSGKLAVAGQGVQIIRQDSDFPGIKKHILAHKGAENGKGGNLKLHTTSGNIGVIIGS
ncbi:unnamed protein product [Discula destructiva]